MRKIVWFVIGLPVAALIVTLAVINRQMVTVVLDPFNPQNPAFSLSLPLFIFLFAALALGVLLGGCLTWIGQGKWRRRARQNRTEATKWRNQAERQQRTPPQPEATALPAPDRDAA